MHFPIKTRGNEIIVLTQVKDGEEATAEAFWAANSYVAGGYDQRRDFEMLTQEMARYEDAGRQQANRLFYLALPPSVFEHVTTQLKETCMSASGANNL